MIENLNLATNKTYLPGVELPESESYYLSPEEYNTLVLKIKELIDSHNNLSLNVEGNISVLSIVFRRTNDKIVGTPVGGSFSSPYPTSTPVWTDGIPDGEATLWASSRIFTSDGKAPQQHSWQTPTKMTDTSYFDVEFSSLEEPGNPTTNPENWSNDGNSSTIWMATAVLRNGEKPKASDWNIVRIKGEAGADGKDQEYIFIRRATTEPPYDISVLPPVQVTEYIPEPAELYGQWTDDPIGVNASIQFEWVSKRVRNNGLWGRFSKPALWARYALDGDGQSSFKSFVFKRTIDKPSIPVGGSFNSPLPNPLDGWTDYVPSGNNPLWVSTRMFSKDGAPPQEHNWTEPVIMADSSEMDIAFSKHITPGDPTNNPSLWTEYADEETIWLAMRHFSAGEWTEWQIVKIKGEGGTGVSVGTVYLYKRSSTTPMEPSGELTYNFSTGLLTGDLEGWSQIVPENDGNPIWITFATASSLELTDIIQSSEWTDPVILAQDGSKSAVVSLYARSEEAPQNPTTVCEYIFDTQTLTGSYSPWSTIVPTTNGYPLWMISATAYSSTASDLIYPDDWSSAITLVKDGQDGPGYESIFILTENTTVPSTPPTSQVDDYVPPGWSDDPLSVTSQYRFCWISKRNKKNGVWGNFSTPKVFSNYSRDGVPGPTNGMVYYQLDSVSPPLTPSALYYDYGSGTFVGLTNNWEVGAPTYVAGNQKSYWYSTYTVVYVGDRGHVSFQTPRKAINFTGLVSFTSENEIKDDNGNTLSFGVSGGTTINGDQIHTGKIKSTNYQTMDGNTGYTNGGMVIDLDNQTIHAPKFQILPTGEIKMKGEHNISDAVLVGCNLKSTNYAVGDEGFSSAGTYINLLNGSFMTKNFKIDSTGNAVFKGTIDAATMTGDLYVGAGKKIYSGDIIQDHWGRNYSNFYISSNNVSLSVPLSLVGSLLYLSDGASMVLDEKTYVDFLNLTPESVWNEWRMSIKGVEGDFRIFGKLSVTQQTTFTSTVTAHAFFQSSDINKKENIYNISLEQTLKADRIQLKQFNFTDDSKKLLKFGVIAQDVEKVFPDLVNTDDKGEKTVDYISLLILKIKNLEQKIKNLENSIK